MTLNEIEEAGRIGKESGEQFKRKIIELIEKWHCAAPHAKEQARKDMLRFCGIDPSNYVKNKAGYLEKKK